MVNCWVCSRSMLCYNDNGKLLNLLKVNGDNGTLLGRLKVNSDNGKLLGLLNFVI